MKHHIKRCNPTPTIIAFNKKAKYTRPWASILIFSRMLFQDFDQVFLHSLSTAWQRSRVLVRSPASSQNYTGCTFYFSPKKTRRFSHNHRKSKGSGASTDCFIYLLYLFKCCLEIFITFSYSEYF